MTFFSISGTIKPPTSLATVHLFKNTLNNLYSVFFRVTNRIFFSPCCSYFRLAAMQKPTETYALHIITMGYLNLDNTRGSVRVSLIQIYISHLISFVFGVLCVCSTKEHMDVLFICSTGEVHCSRLNQASLLSQMLVIIENLVPINGHIYTHGHKHMQCHGPIQCKCANESVGW